MARQRRLGLQTRPLCCTRVTPILEGKKASSHLIECDPKGRRRVGWDSRPDLLVSSVYSEEEVGSGDPTYAKASQPTLVRDARPLLALPRAGNSHLLAILGDRPPRHVQAVFLEFLHQVVIAVRVLLILFVDDFL